MKGIFLHSKIFYCRVASEREITVLALCVNILLIYLLLNDSLDSKLLMACHPMYGTEGSCGAWKAFRKKK